MLVLIRRSQSAKTCSGLTAFAWDCVYPFVFFSRRALFEQPACLYLFCLFTVMYFDLMLCNLVSETVDSESPSPSGISFALENLEFPPSWSSFSVSPLPQPVEIWSKWICIELLYKNRLKSNLSLIVPFFLASIYLVRPFADTNLITDYNVVFDSFYPDLFGDRINRARLSLSRVDPCSIVLAVCNRYCLQLIRTLIPGIT